MKKVTTICHTLEQVSQANAPVSYVPGAEPGGWKRFVQYVAESGVTSFDGWTVADFFRLLMAYIFNGQNTPPFVCSQYYDNASDDTPSYKLTVFDVSYAQLDALDRTVQPSWFDVTIEPAGALYTVALNPKRSLMKLIYKNLV